MATYALRLITRQADVCVQQWRRTNGVTEDHPLTATAYRAIAAKGQPANPTTDPNATFVMAWSEPRFDVGTPQPGDLYEVTTGADWFNGAWRDGQRRIRIELEARDQPLHVLMSRLSNQLSNVRTLSVTDTSRAGVTVVSGELRLDDGRNV